MEDNDFLEQEILKRIDEMENQKYEFPKKFSVKDYIITGLIIFICLVMVIYGAFV